MGFKFGLIQFGNFAVWGFTIESSKQFSNGSGLAKVFRVCWRLLDVVFSGLGGSNTTER